MANGFHRPWIAAAAKAGLVSFESATIKVKAAASPTGKDETVAIPDGGVPVFTLTSGEDAARLFALAEADRGTVEVDGQEVPGENPVNLLLAYAAGLNARAKTRAQFEAAHEDPEKAIKKIAESLVKAGRFKSFEKALAAARLLQETDE